MKKADVKVGNVYRAKVTNRVVDVRIEGESPHGGWTATNLATGKSIRVKSAQRLRPGGATTATPVAAGADEGTTAAPAAEAATRAKQGEGAAKRAKGHKVIRDDGKVVRVTVPGADEPPAPAAAVNPAIKATEKARKEAIKIADTNLTAIEAVEKDGEPAGGKRGTTKAAAAKRAASKRTSALDAAAQVLAKAKEPMRCKDIVAAMAEQGLWSSPGGKTPEATLNAAIIREIGKKRKDSRFIKAGRGLFAANPEGAE